MSTIDYIDYSDYICKHCFEGLHEMCLDCDCSCNDIKEYIGNENSDVFNGTFSGGIMFGLAIVINAFIVWILLG